MNLTDIRNSRVQSMTLAALLIAVGVIFSGVFSFYLPLFGYPSLKVDLTSVILMVSGMLLGPWYGALVGAGTDLIGYVLFSPGTYHPGITFNAIMFGVIGGLVSRFIWQPREFKSMGYINIAIAMLLLGGGVTYVLVTNTVFAGGESILLTPTIKLSLILSMILISLAMIAALVVIAYKYRSLMSLVQLAVFAILVTEVVLNILIMPIWIEQLMGIPYPVGAFVRVFRAIFLIPFKLVLTLALLRLTRLKTV